MKLHSDTVLVVDSNPLDRSTICASLKDQGYTVVEAEGGRQAMARKLRKKRRISKMRKMARALPKVAVTC